MNLWGLTEGGKEISLANNATILPIGIPEGVFTKILGKMISTDYLVIECAGKGQITLGRSLLELLGEIIDVGKGPCTFLLHQTIIFSPRLRIKVREVRARNLVLMLLHLRTLDFFLLLMPNLNALNKSTY